MEFILDKLLVTGPISLNTPSCVIIDVALSRSIILDIKNLSEVNYRSDVIRTINNIPPHIVNLPVSNVDLPKLAQYLNPDPNVNWTKSTLLSCFTHVMNLSKSTSVPQLEDLNKVRIGDPEPNIFKTPIFILYKWTLILGGIPTHSMTPENILNYIVLLKSSRSVLISKLFNLLVKDNKTIALSLINSTNSEIDPTALGRIPSEEVTRYYSTSQKVVLQSPIPLTKIDAVVSAAGKDLDLTYSDSILQDYYSMFLNGNLQVFYSIHMNNVIKLNPLAYNLKHTFNPIFPASFYELSTLTKIAAVENIEIPAPTTKNYVYQELSTSILVDTFYSSARHGILNFTTSISLTDILDEDDSPIVYYGHIESFTPFTVAELCNYFDSEDGFVLPARSRSIVLSKESMDKLKFIINLNLRKLRQKTTTLFAHLNQTNVNNRKELKHIHEWNELSRIISLVETRQVDINSRKIYISKLYTQMESRGKEESKSMVSKILQLGLFMRGWDGISKVLPIAVVPKYDFDVVEARASIKLVEFMEYCKGLKIANVILGLPLIGYKNGSYEININKTKGLTVGDRLKIVMEGKHGGNINACMRMSSNYMLYSACFYMISIDVQPPFNPNKVHVIT